MRFCSRCRAFGEAATRAEGPSSDLKTGAFIAVNATATGCSVDKGAHPPLFGRVEHRHWLGQRGINMGTEAGGLVGPVEQEEPATTFDSALAPLGLPVATAAVAAPEVSYWERLGQARAARHLHNRYI